MNSKLMCGVKGCFSVAKIKFLTEIMKEEVTKTIEKLKQRNPMALLTVDVLEFASDSLVRNNEEPEEEEDRVMWEE